MIDLRADGGRADETTYETCQMCGNEKIRFVHVMAHDDVAEPFRVGCVCAEKMSNDYEGPRRREARLRNRAVRHSRWLSRKWRVSSKGNPFLNVEGHNLGIYRTKTGRWGYRIGSRFGQRTYAAIDDAKLALFDDFWAITQEDDRLWAGDSKRQVRPVFTDWVPKVWPGNGGKPAGNSCVPRIRYGDAVGATTAAIMREGGSANW